MVRFASSIHHFDGLSGLTIVQAQTTIHDFLNAIDDTLRDKVEAEFQAVKADLETEVEQASMIVKLILQHIRMVQNAKKVRHLVSRRKQF